MGAWIELSLSTVLLGFSMIEASKTVFFTIASCVGTRIEKILKNFRFNVKLSYEEISSCFNNVLLFGVLCFCRRGGWH